MAALLLALALATLIVIMVIGLWILAYRVPWAGGVLGMAVALDAVHEIQRVFAHHHPMPSIPLTFTIPRIVVGVIAIGVATTALARRRRVPAAT